MRNTFIKSLIEQARLNDTIVLIVGDLGYSVVEPFAAEFPDRFYNAGISEQNMIGVASALSNENHKIITTSFAPFATSTTTIPTTTATLVCSSFHARRTTSAATTSTHYPPQPFQKLGPPCLFFLLVPFGAPPQPSSTFFFRQWCLEQRKCVDSFRGTTHSRWVGRSIDPIGIGFGGTTTRG